MKSIRRIRAVFLMLVWSSMLISGASLVMADDIRGMQVPDEIASLRDLLAVVDKTHQGRILEVEMERENVGGIEIWVYEVKLLTRKGKVYELEYNAITLELLKTEN
ncbi:MAG: peptidase [Pseudomonadota bacterium]|nr:peptidase [Pseudomonadota bacterium]